MKKAQNLFQEVGGLLLEDLRVIASSFDKSPKLILGNKIWISHVFLNFHLDIYAEFNNR